MFDMMLSMTLKPSDKNLKSDLKEERIVGSVSFVGPLTGSLQICVGRNFSRQMTSAMLGMEEEEIEGEDDIKDVISELCNIISGNIKSKLCDADMTCELSTPSFTRGNNFIIETQTMVKHEIYSFLHQENPVIVEIALKIGGQPDSSQKQGEAPGLQSAKAIDPQTLIDDMINHEIPSEEDPQKAIDELIAAETPSEDRTDSNEANDQSNDSENNSDNDLYNKNLNLVLDIPVKISVELGRNRKPISELIKIGQGTVVDFSNLAEEPLNIFVNQTLIAKGELLVKNEKYGIKILEIIDSKQRLQTLL